MPARHTIYQLPEFTVASNTQIGDAGVLLGQLWEKFIPVPPTICIPTQTLSEVAQDAQLHLKLEQLQRSSIVESEDTTTKHVLYLLKRLHLDRAFIHKLASLYHEYLDSDSVQVYASNTTTKRESFIVGDAAVIESILVVWADAIAHSIRTLPKRHQSISDVVSAAAILITQQPPALASGVCYTRHPRTLDKNLLSIQAVWGSEGGSKPETAAEIDIDVRTKQIVYRAEHTQDFKCVQGHGELLKKPLSDSEQNTFPITDTEARELAQYCTTLKLKSLKHVTATWIKTSQALYLTGVSDFDPDHSVPTESPQTTFTKLYITGGNPAKASEQLTQSVDGVGLLRSEYCLAQFGTHPMHLLRSHHRDSLRQAMLQTISTYQQESQSKLVLFRTENFTSDELLSLHASNAYTETEQNPAIGLRGALKNLRYPELLQFQIDVFREALQKTTSPLGLIFPFVRSSQECRQLLQYAQECRLGGPYFAGVWLQLNTPENVINIRTYPLKDLAGVILNVSSVIALSQGIDADRSDLQQAYDFPEELYTHLLDQLNTNRVHTDPLKTLVYLRHYNSTAVSIAVNKGVHGIIVRPEVATLAKASIMESESNLFTAKNQHKE